jgi:hypothetical protein
MADLENRLEDGYEKVAIYASPDGILTHAAKQLEDGLWSSELGQLEDVKHRLNALVGDDYGIVFQLLRRRIAGH